MEAITLFGVIITFLVTVFGWIFTYRTQLSILKRQTEFDFDKEQRQILISDRLGFIKGLESWFEKGRAIYLEAVNLSPIQIPSHDAQISSEERKILLMRMEEAVNLINEQRKLRAQAPRLMYLAKLYDSEVEKSSHWDWGTPTMPTDLLQIINAFEDEVIDQISEAIYGDKGRAFPKVEDQFHSLHQAGIQAVERVKQNIVLQEKKKGKKR